MRGSKWETAIGWGCLLAGIVSVYRVETHANSGWLFVTAASVIGLALLYVKKHRLPNRDWEETREQALTEIAHATISPTRLLDEELSAEVQILVEPEEGVRFSARKAMKPEGYQLTLWISSGHFAGAGSVLSRRKAVVPLTKSSSEHYDWRGGVSRKTYEESEQSRRTRLLFEETRSGEDLEVIH